MHIRLMALATAVALTFMLLNTVIDAQLNAEMELSQNMLFYFAYILPISSVIAVVIALTGLYFAPDAERARECGEAINAYKQQQFAAYIAARKAELLVQRAIANAQLGARITAAKTVASHYQSEDVRRRIEGAAVASIPALLRQIGVNEASNTAVPAQNDYEGSDGEPVTATYDDLQALVDDLVRERLAAERAAQPVTPAPNGHGANFTHRPGGR
ncbi:MAG: hypothetical protein KF770_05070 [Anaerolineae bacterium]|nr:hypothetical protein [Anaerolineae bacterium]